MTRPIVFYLAMLLLIGLLVLAPAGAQQPPPSTVAPTVNVEVPPDTVPGQPTDGSAGESATDLAKKLQNPIGDLYNVPFQNNTNFNVGPHNGTQNILYIHPVIPIHLNEDWNVITRTILPLVWSPSFQPAQSVPFGTAPTAFSVFLSPKNPNDGWIWGVGPIMQLPTISSKSLGSNVWGAGPAFVVVKIAGPIVGGGLINNVFSFGGTDAPGGTR